MRHAGRAAAGDQRHMRAVGGGMVNAYNSAAAMAPKPLATISAPAGNVSIQPGGTVSFQ